MEEKDLLVGEYLDLAVEYSNMIISAEAPDLEKKSDLKKRLNDYRAKLGMELM